MKKNIGLLVLLIVLCTVVALLNHNFLSAANLGNMGRLSGIFGIFAIGMGMIIITGGIDVSMGSMFALQGVLLVMALLHVVEVGGDPVPNWPWPVGVAAIILGSMVLGWIHGWLVTRVRLQPFIVTLCGLLIYRGLARFIANDETKGFGSDGFEVLRFLANGSVFLVPMPIIILAVVTIAAWILVHKSVYGRHLFAVGRNEDAARYAGIDSRRVITIAYVLGAGLAGLAGVLIAFYTNSVSPSGHGTFYELYAVAAAVLGGCSLRGGEGSVIGIVLGTILLQVLQNLVNMLGIPSSLNFAVMGTVILVGVVGDQVMSRRKAGRRTT